VKSFKENFEYDILNFVENDPIKLDKLKNDTNYEFYMSEDQKNNVETQLQNNKSKNLNSKLRDMTVYTATNQFFYDVRRVK